MRREVTIVGGGFTGLAAALDLVKKGVSVRVLERDSSLGGLAGTFDIAPGCSLEKFYHHWFTSDRDALELVKELGIPLGSRPTNTGLYFANTVFRLASPWDLLKFTPISFISRIRTGLMALKARRIENWRDLEEMSAEDWIIRYAGKESYNVVWRPLLEGKFGAEAKNISAVWFWNKLKLRGSSRGESGEERLYYLEGGFRRLLDALEKRLRELGVQFELGCAVKRISRNASGQFSIETTLGERSAESVLVTTPIPTFLEMVPSLPTTYREKLREVRYIGNICLVLGLSRSLSSTYWMNVAEPDFPFVGVIEHTNFDPPENYDGLHIVYLSKYLPTTDLRYSYSTDELFTYALPFLQKMFPDFQKDWVKTLHLWREPYSQPVIVRKSSELIPEVTTPEKGLYLSTMAQVYPEDRGTSYAIRGGKEAAKIIYDRL